MENKKKVRFNLSVTSTDYTLDEDEINQKRGAFKKISNSKKEPFSCLAAKFDIAASKDFVNYDEMPTFEEDIIPFIEMPETPLKEVVNICNRTKNFYTEYETKRKALRKENYEKHLGNNHGIRK